MQFSTFTYGSYIEPFTFFAILPYLRLVLAIATVLEKNDQMICEFRHSHSLSHFHLINPQRHSILTFTRSSRSSSTQFHSYRWLHSNKPYSEMSSIIWSFFPCKWKIRHAMSVASLLSFLHLYYNLILPYEPTLLRFDQFLSSNETHTTCKSLRCGCPTSARKIGLGGVQSTPDLCWNCVGRPREGQGTHSRPKNRSAFEGIQCDYKSTCS